MSKERAREHDEGDVVKALNGGHEFCLAVAREVLLGDPAKIHSLQHAYELIEARLKKGVRVHDE
jgi:hypothetical protein